MKIALGLPVGEIVYPQTAVAVALMSFYAGKNGHDLAFFSEKSPYVDINANRIFKRAQKEECDYLMMVETDLEDISGGDVLSHMISLGADVVSGIYYRGVYPYRPLIHSFTENLGELMFPGEWPTEQPFTIDCCGSGFMLISKKVLDAFTPEFVEEWGEAFDHFIVDKKIVWRNDIAFCWRLKQLGIKPLIEPRIKLGHVKIAPVTSNHWEASRKHMKETGKVVI